MINDKFNAQQEKTEKIMEVEFYFTPLTFQMVKFIKSHTTMSV